MISQQAPQLRSIVTLCASLALCATLVMDVRSQPSAQFQPAASGWLYVTASSSEPTSGRIMIVDPEQGRVVGSLARGKTPDIVPSLDGTRLFVSYDRLSGERIAGAFEVIDATTGSVLLRREEVEARGGMGGGYRSRMTLSTDGSWLFRYKSWTSDLTGTSYWVETFDTARGQMLADKASVPLCGDATMVPGAQRDVLFVVCPASEDLRIVTLTASGGLANAQPARVSLGSGLKPGFPPAVLLQDGGRTLTVIKSDGSVVKVDTATHSILLREVVDRARRQVPIADEQTPPGRRMKGQSPADWLAGRAVHGAGASVSTDGTMMYVNVLGEKESAIVVLNALTFERVGTIPYRALYASFTLSSDGKRLYAVDRQRGLLSVFDTGSGIELRTIDVGPNPVFAVIAP